jgi:hypothetical protein
MTHNGMTLQTLEFTAAQLFADALRAHDLTPVIDDDYPAVRFRYEQAAAMLIKTFIDNGRIGAPVQPATPVQRIIGEIEAEIGKALAKFPTWPTRIIDAGNVVSEEAGELAKACLQVVYEPHKESLAGVRQEAIQTAAMCIRFLLSLDQYELSPGPQHKQELG